MGAAVVTSAWGDSWGWSWGDSWGAIDDATQSRGGGTYLTPEELARLRREVRAVEAARKLSIRKRRQLERRVEATIRKAYAAATGAGGDEVFAPVVQDDRIVIDWSPRADHAAGIIAIVDELQRRADRVARQVAEREAEDRATAARAETIRRMIEKALVAARKAIEDDEDDVELLLMAL